MSLALAIHGFPGANETIRRHWPFYERAGADEIVGIGTSDGKTEFPEGIRTELIGPNLYIVGPHLPSRLIRTLEHLMLLRADWIAIAEYDCLFFRRIPDDLPRGLTTHLAGGKMPGAYANQFYHWPYICDRDTAMRIIRFGNELLATKQHDYSPDLFIGQVCELAEIPVHTDILKSYSRNTINCPQWEKEAREAIANGAVSIHGVKSKEVLEAITR